MIAVTRYRHSCVLSREEFISGTFLMFVFLLLGSRNALILFSKQEMLLPIVIRV